MESSLLSELDGWSGNGVVVRVDRPTGSRIFVALHDHTLGQPVGGTRMKTYPRPADALRDALRLAEGMTYKWAGLGVDRGGGKAVIDIPAGLASEARLDLLRRYGSFLQTLGGVFSTGADLGTSAEDMAVVAETCPYVFGVDYQTGKPTDPGPFTAHGVLVGLRASLEHAFGSADPTGRTVLVQGVGGVGAPLARSLAAAGADLLLADLDGERAERLAAEVGGRALAAEEVYDTACDVYAPCAVGGTLNPDTVPRLRCRLVAGSANNQLLGEADADRLAERGILYVPDYILNAGGALAFHSLHAGQEDHQILMHEVEDIAKAVSGILREAAASDVSPLRVARRQVDRLLDARRGGNSAAVT